jgi:hypothetical protein
MRSFHNKLKRIGAARQKEMERKERVREREGAEEVKGETKMT